MKKLKISKAPVIDLKLLEKIAQKTLKKYGFKFDSIEIDEDELIISLKDFDSSDLRQKPGISDEDFDEEIDVRATDFSSFTKDFEKATGWVFTDTLDETVTFSQ